MQWETRSGVLSLSDAYRVAAVPGPGDTCRLFPLRPAKSRRGRPRRGVKGGPTRFDPAARRAAERQSCRAFRRRPNRRGRSRGRQPSRPSLRCRPEAGCRGRAHRSRESEPGRPLRSRSRSVLRQRVVGAVDQPDRQQPPGELVATVHRPENVEEVPRRSLDAKTRLPRRRPPDADTATSGGRRAVRPARS